MADLQSSKHNDPKSNYYHEDEITLKEFIHKIKEFSKEVWRKKNIIICAIILCAGLMLFRTYLGVTTYSAGMTFMVDQQENTNRSKVISVFGEVVQIGVENNKITELARSARIIHPVLLSKVLLEEKLDYVANHLIDLYGLQAAWEEEKKAKKYKNLTLNGFRFIEPRLEELSLQEKRALNIVHELTAGNNFSGKQGIMKIAYDENVEMFRLNVDCNNEDFSIILMEQVFDQLKKFYTEGTFGRQEESLILWQSRSDSLEILYKNLENQLVYVQDRSRGLISQSSNMNITNLSRERDNARSEYEIASNNLESTKLSLNRSRPEFNVVDRTFFPIVNSASKFKAGIIGAFIGFFFSLIYVLGRKVIRDALAEA